MLTCRPGCSAHPPMCHLLSGLQVHDGRHGGMVERSMNAVLARDHPARVAATAFSTETGISCCSSTWLGEVVRVFGCVLPFALSWQPLDIHDTPFARPRAFVVSHFVRVDVRNGQINAGGVVWCLRRRCWRGACVGCCGCGAWCLVPLVWLLMCRRLCSVRGIWRRCRVAGRAGSAGSASFF